MTSEKETKGSQPEAKGKQGRAKDRSIGERRAQKKKGTVDQSHTN